MRQRDLRKPLLFDIPLDEKSKPENDDLKKTLDILHVAENLINNALQLQAMQDKLETLSRAKKSCFWRLFYGNSDEKALQTLPESIKQIKKTIHSPATLAQQKQISDYIKTGNESKNSEFTQLMIHSLTESEKIKQYRPQFIKMYELECKIKQAERAKNKTQTIQYQTQMEKEYKDIAYLNFRLPYPLNEIMEITSKEIDKNYIQQRMALLYLRQVVDLLNHKRNIRMEHSVRMTDSEDELRTLYIHHIKVLNLQIKESERKHTSKNTSLAKGTMNL